MARVLWIFGLILFLTWWLRGKPPLFGGARDDARRPPVQPRGSMPMVRCRRCGLYLPAEEALHVHGADYCCAEHARS